MQTPNFALFIALAALVAVSSGVSAQKRGLLFPWDSVPADLSSGGFTQAKCPKAVSYIDWESWTFSPADPAFEFIAMARTQNDVAALATYMPTNKAKKIAFLNEPDLPGSTALPVSTAVQIWNQKIIPYRKSGIQLLSPAITSDESKGLPWLAQFMAAVPSAKPDYIALHYYGTDATAFQTYVTKVYNLYKLPVYITEVASTSSDITSVKAFMTGVTSWCDKQSWIAGVFWFAASRTANTGNVVQSALMSSTGARTPLGDLYCTS